MSKLPENAFSREDSLHLAANELGKPQKRYQFDPRSFYVLYFGGSILFFFGILFAIVSESGVGQSDGHPWFILWSFLILGGGFVWFYVVPNWRSTHVILCEYGLIQVSKKMKHARVEVVYWKDIRLGEEIGMRGEYSLLYQDKRLRLSRYYQGFDELITAIRQGVREDREKHEK